MDIIIRSVWRILLTFFLFAIPANKSLLAQLSFGVFPEYISGTQSHALGSTISSKYLNVLDPSLNPSSLSNFRSIITSYSFAQTRLKGTNSSIGIVIPTKTHGAFGISFFNYRADMTVSNGNDQFSSISYNRNTAIISYGQYLSKNFAVGIGTKLVYFSFGTIENGLNNLGINFSIQYRLPFQHPLFKNINTGFSVDNLIQPYFKVSSQKENVPRDFRIFMDKSIQFVNSEINIIYNVSRLDRNKFREGKKYYSHWGLQYSYKSILFIRAGYLTKNIVWGGGVKIKRFIIDYSYGDYSKDYPRILFFKHFISLSFILSPDFKS